MVIFSVGGVGMGRHGKRAVLRCQPSVVTLSGPPVIVLDPFPALGGGAASRPEADPHRGVVAGGRARLLRGEVELDARPLAAPGRGRWDDLDVLSFAAATLFGWIVLPAMLHDPALAVRELEGPRAGALGRLEVTAPPGWPAGATRHVLHVDADGLVHRHEEGRLVHELAGHCDFDGALIATRRRTRARVGGRLVPLRWADVVAAHVLADPAAQTLNQGPPAADT